MDVDSYLAQLSADVDRMAAVAADASLDTPVPTCPGWVLRDLMQHLGGVHAWARTFVAEARREPIRSSLEEQVGGWPHDSELIDWFSSGGHALVAALDSAPVDLDAWTFLDAPTPRIHWARRQTHETAIHRVDAELTAGSESVSFGDDVALDGIDEVLCAFISRRRRGPRHHTATALGVSVVDTGSSWTVAFDQDSSVTSLGIGDVAVQIDGDADSVYRWLWNRIGREAVTVSGDVAIADVWTETGHKAW